MKNLLILLVLFISSFSYAQNCLTRDSLYQNYDEKLVHSEVVLVDSVGQIELVKRVKNWGGKTFINLKEVLVAETDNQLIFNYTTTSSGVSKYGNINSITYVRLIVVFKDGRIKASLFDDGNVAGAGTPARTYFYTNAFPKLETTICNKGNEKTYYEIYKNYRLNLLSTLESLKSALKINSLEFDDDF